MSQKTVAIACQGGGSHTAFTAGVLDALLDAPEHGFFNHYKVTGLSGTSGGAICAILTWYGLHRRAAHGEEESVTSQLLRFWQNNEAQRFMEHWFNFWAVNLLRWNEHGISFFPQLSPYQVNDEALGLWLMSLGMRSEFLDLRTLIEQYVTDEAIIAIQKQADAAHPRLFIGAVDMQRGTFKAFDSQKCEICIDAVLASAALPTLFKAVEVSAHMCHDNADNTSETGYYWDGLFSQNPPIKPFFENNSAAQKPDELWVIQINPTHRETIPTLLGDILDRRNELAGNLSLFQELKFVNTVNTWIDQGLLQKGERFKPITVRHITMSDEIAKRLDHISKIDRTSVLIDELIDDGRQQGRAFWKTLTETTQLQSTSSPSDEQ